eukprot:567587-Amphidinium_carterae.1
MKIGTKKCAANEPQLHSKDHPPYQSVYSAGRQRSLGMRSADFSPQPIATPPPPAKNQTKSKSRLVIFLLLTFLG